MTELNQDIAILQLGEKIDSDPISLPPKKRLVQFFALQNRRKSDSFAVKVVHNGFLKKNSSTILIENTAELAYCLTERNSTLSAEEFIALKPFENPVILTDDKLQPGDSGGPLMVKIDQKWTILGVLSARIEWASQRYGLYIDATHYLPWINHIISNSTYSMMSQGRKSSSFASMTTLHLPLL